MGREWYFKWATKKATKSTTCGDGGGGTSGDDIVKQRSTTPPELVAVTMEAAVTRGGGRGGGRGCMSGVFHLFDFHQFMFCSYPPHEVNLSVVQPTSLKVVETPSKKSTRINLSIQTLTKQEDSCSEGARTPNLVARLMGLDILPDTCHSNTTTPRSSHFSTTTTTTTTPASTSQMKTRPRLSLEFNKENCSIVREMESSRRSCSAITANKKKKDAIIELESKSPKYYAKQIMKQAKENVIRRSFGGDITNNKTLIRRDEHLLLEKPKKAYKVYKENSKPKLENLKPKAIQEKKKQMQEANIRVSKPCSKKSIQKSCLDSTGNKKEERFIRPKAYFDEKCKKNTRLSSDPTKLPHKQGASLKARSSKLLMSTRARLSRNPSHGGERRSTKDTTTSIAEFQYISRILKSTGIDENTPVSLTTLFSPTHFLDPSIFHNLEITHYTPTSDNISFYFGNNRRLIFHLVDEFLGKDYRQDNREFVNGFELVKILCERIRSIPSLTNSQTLQDIDTLVEKDLPSIAFEEEGEAIVSEIEQDIVDSLVQEIAVFMFCSGMCRSSMQRFYVKKN